MGIFQKFLAKSFNTGAGLKPYTKRDPRDFQIGWFWQAGYQPKNRKVLLESVTTKNQYRNTCGWNAASGMKEIDEKIELDEMALVMAGKEKGRISQDGFSYLVDNQKTLLDFGIPRKGMIKEDRSSWEVYSDFKKLTPEVRADAAKHKIKSFMFLRTVEEVYKALDEGRPVEIGVDWYSGFQASGGFSMPWLVHKIIGFFLGGHAMYVRGYDLDFKVNISGVNQFYNTPKENKILIFLNKAVDFLRKIFISDRIGALYDGKVFVVKNSFGESYGNKGDLYLTPEMLQKNIEKYSAIMNYDLEPDLISWLKTHQGKVVKTTLSPDVFLIQGDKKRKYDDMATLIAHGKQISDITVIETEILDKVKIGDNIDFWSGGNVRQIKQMFLWARENYKEMEDEMKQYFTELF